jgi:DHA1 family tetracycline resistance protein-like MFS transporter
MQKKSAIYFILVTILIDTIGFGLIIPVMPTLIMDLTHGTIGEASSYGGWLLAAYAIMQFFFGPIAGGLSDRFGRRPVLLASLFGFTCDYLFLVFAQSIEWLFVGRLIAGMMGASFTTAGAYIADISTPETRSQNFGMIGAAFGLGFIIGPMIGGLLGDIGPRVPFMAAAGLTMVNWLYGFFILPESLKPENRRKFDWSRANPVGTFFSLAKYPVIGGLLISLAFLYLAMQAMQSNWSFFTTAQLGWDAKAIGISLAVVGVVFAIVQGGLIRIIIPRLGQYRSVYLGLSLYMIGLVLYAFAYQTWMMYAFTIVYCMGGIAGPALQGVMSAGVPPNAQGELQGGFTSLMSVTAIFGPVLTGELFAYFTGPSAPLYFPGAAMLLAASLILVSVVLAWRTLRKHPEPPMPQQQQAAAAN